MKKFDLKNSTASWTKLRDLRHTHFQYLLQQNHFGTGRQDNRKKKEKTTCDLSTDQGRQRVCYGDIRSISDVRIP